MAILCKHCNVVLMDHGSPVRHYSDCQNYHQTCDPERLAKLRSDGKYNLMVLTANGREYKDGKWKTRMVWRIKRTDTYPRLLGFYRRMRSEKRVIVRTDCKVYPSAIYV